MKPEKATTEHFIYGLALLLAACIRFIGLGNNPLTDSEARWALQAFAAANGSHALLGPQPGYILLTGASFFVAGASDFLARFWPALAGTLLVLAPYLFREHLGKKAAVVLALGLALEPALVAASHQADGRMLALSAVVFALGFALKGNAPLAGIAAGLSLLGGPSVWNGLIAVVLGFGAGRLLARKPVEGGQPVQLNGRSMALRAAGTVVFVGTLFGFLPGGLSALGESLVSFLQGWVGGAGTPILLMLIGWIVLSPLVILFGVSGMIRTLLHRDPVDETLFWIWAFSFLIFLAYPARQVADLAWGSVPLLAIAARQVGRLSGIAGFCVPVLGYAFLVAVLGFSVSLSYQGLLANLPPEQLTLRWGGLLGTLFLLGASFLLVAWGWAWRVAMTGVIFGLSCVLLVYTLGAAWSGAGLGSRPEAELWIEGVFPKESALTLKVLGDASEWSTGRRDTLDLLVSGIDTPSLRWVLRNYSRVTYVSQLPPDAQPGVVITSEVQGANLGLPAAYTGQRLGWGEVVNWSALLPGDWFHWLFYRDLVDRTQLISRQNLILWVRSDLFPGAVKTGTTP